jgi:hypothetical protein
MSPDELRPPLLKKSFDGKRALKLPHLNHQSDYISVSFGVLQAIQQFLWSIALTLLSATGGWDFCV